MGLAERTVRGPEETQLLTLHNVMSCEHVCTFKSTLVDQINVLIHR